jgi:hypothetical protein
LVSSNPNALPILLNNKNNIIWDWISLNPNIFKEIKDNNVEIVKKAIEIILINSS